MTGLDRELARTLVAVLRDDPELRDELRALLLPNEPVEAESPWLATDEAAGYLRVSERTLERRIKSGRVRSTTIGRRRLFHRDDLDGLARNGGGGGESASQLHPATEE